MREVERIARLLEETFSGRAYHGPSVLVALQGISASDALRKLDGGAHSIWELVAHLTAELRHARALLEGTAVQWIEGETTWPRAATPAVDWPEAISALSEANSSLVEAVARLDDAQLEQQLTQVRRTYYVMLHGTVQHNVYHAGQISLLRRQMTGVTRSDK